MKPPAFLVWVFGLMGARPGDTLDDLYPGSGMVARTWSAWSSPADASPDVGDDALARARHDASFVDGHDGSPAARGDASAAAAADG